MTNVLWDPFPVLRSRRAFAAAPRPAWTPNVEVVRAEDATTVRLDVPGVRPEDLEVTVVDSVLAIRGERRSGSSTTAFERRFSLPDGIDPATVEAVHEHGVLELRLPVTRPEPRTIPIAVRAGEGGQDGEAQAHPEAIDVGGEPSDAEAKDAHANPKANSEAMDGAAVS